MTLPSKLVLPAFLLLVFLLPVFLGPIFYFVLAHFGVPFHRAMTRALIVSALVGLYLFRHHLQLRAWWPPGPVAWRQAGLGLLVALVSAQTMIAMDFALPGVHVIRLNVARVTHAVLTALVAAAIVPPLEETLFRGFLISRLRETLGRRLSWVLGAALFTLVHFLRPDSSHSQAPVHWWSGATSVVFMFTHLAQGEIIGGRGLNIFLVGLILGGIFLRAGTLWITAGLHCGWIFTLVIFAALTRPAEKPRIPFLAGDLIGTPITTVVLLLVGLWFYFFSRPLPSTGGAPAQS
jgi:membrane protease YdiL (CAAX protease family)